MTLRALCCILGGTLLGCSRGESSGDRIERLMQPVRRSVQDEPLTANDDRRNTLRIVLDSADVRVGGEGAVESEEFGWPVQAAFAESGAVVILDRLKGRLVAVSVDGSLVQPFGRRGEGPGEIKEATHLIATGPDRFELIDNALHRRSTLSLGPAGLTLVGSARFDRQASSVCQVNGQWIALDYDPIEQRSFSRLREDGIRESSFGLPLLAASGMLNSDILVGNLLCSASASSVVYAAPTGDIISYGIDGSFRWRRQAEQFVPPGIREMGGGVMWTAAPAPGNASMAPMAIVQVEDSLVVLQFMNLARVTESDGKQSIERVGMDTRILLLRNGQEVGRQTDLPRFLSTSRGRMAITGEEPEPWVEVRRFRVVGATPQQ